jgi:hypothetical protein
MNNNAVSPTERPAFDLLEHLRNNAELKKLKSDEAQELLRIAEDHPYLLRFWHLMHTLNGWM